MNNASTIVTPSSAVTHMNINTTSSDIQAILDSSQNMADSSTFYTTSTKLLTSAQNSVKESIQPNNITSTNIYKQPNNITSTNIYKSLITLPNTNSKHMYITSKKISTNASNTNNTLDSINSTIQTITTSNNTKYYSYIFGFGGSLFFIVIGILICWICCIRK